MPCILAQHRHQSLSRNQLIMLGLNYKLRVCANEPCCDGGETRCGTCKAQVRAFYTRKAMSLRSVIRDITGTFKSCYILQNYQKWRPVHLSSVRASQGLSPSCKEESAGSAYVRTAILVLENSFTYFQTAPRMRMKFQDCFMQ